MCNKIVIIDLFSNETITGNKRSINLEILSSKIAERLVRQLPKEWQLPMCNEYDSDLMEIIEDFCFHIEPEDIFDYEFDVYLNRLYDWAHKKGVSIDRPQR